MRSLQVTVLLAAALVSACAAPAVPTVPQERPLTPLEAIAGYRLTDAVTEAPGGLTVNGVSPAVSGSEGAYHFMVRPATHEVMRVDGAGNMAAWGKLGGQAAQFNHPESLFVANGEVYVADTNNHRIQVFDANGKSVAMWGDFGNRPGQFIHPRSVEVTRGGLVIVVDDYSIQYFSGDGAQLGRIPMLSATAPVERSLTQIQSAVPPQTLAQFVTANPGVAQVAQVLKTQGMSDADIVKTLTAATVGGIPGAQPIPAAQGGLAVAANVQNLNADIFQFMALFQKMAQEMRDGVRLDRETQMQSQISTIQSAAEKMREAAEARFTAAVVQGAMQIGAGAISIGGATAALNTPTTSGKMGSALETMSSAKGGERVIGNLSPTGVGSSAGGMGTIGSAGLDKAAGDADAKKAELEAQARTADSARDQANEVMQQMQDLIRDIREKLQAIEQTQVEINRGIARNI